MLREGAPKAPRRLREATVVASWTRVDMIRQIMTTVPEVSGCFEEVPQLEIDHLDTISRAQKREHNIDELLEPSSG